jgi:hypothetical protein
VKIEAVRGGVITGRVVTEDDQPLAGAEVKLRKRKNGKWTPVDCVWAGTPDRALATDRSGVYRISGLSEGELQSKQEKQLDLTVTRPRK